MNLKRATILAFVTYFIIFIIASIVMFASSVEMIGYVMIFVMPFIITLIAKYLYFDKVKLRHPLKESFIIGIYWLVIAIILDVIILIYGFGVGWEMFTNPSWTLILGYAEYVIFCVIASSIRKKT